MTIALFGREIDRVAAPKLISLLDILADRGAILCYYSNFYRFLCEELGVTLPQGLIFSSVDDLPKETSVILSIGGDGTFLSAVSIVKDKKIPIAGVNFGRLGFLTTVQPDQNSSWIDDLFEGRYECEDRMLLKVDSKEIFSNFNPYAVNEISIQRKNPSMLGIKVVADGKELPVYWADGIVISTPTGSTAYSLSVGGPVVVPSSNVLLISPIAPHNLNIRPLVVPSDISLEISVVTRGNNAIVSVDNRYFEIGDNGKIFVSKAEFDFKYLHFSNNTFIEALKEKLLWGEDKRNLSKCQN